MMRRRSGLSHDLRRGDRSTWGGIVLAVLVVVVAPAFFPKLRWRQRLGWQGHVAFISAQTLWSTLSRHWLLPWVQAFERDNIKRREEAQVQLRAELGREPTSGEVAERHRAMTRAEFEVAEH